MYNPSFRLEPLCGPCDVDIARLCFFLQDDRHGKNISTIMKFESGGTKSRAIKCI